MTHCPLCDFSLLKKKIPSRSDLLFTITCKRCGIFNFGLGLHMHKDLQEKIKKSSYILSGIAREKHENQEHPPTFTEDNFKQYLNDKMIPDLDSSESRGKKLLKYLQIKENEGKNWISLDYEIDYSLVYAKNSDEFKRILLFLAQCHFIEVNEHQTNNDCKLRISEEGKKEMNKRSIGFEARD